MSIFWVDKEFVTEDEALVSVKDIAILRGFGVFDFMRTYNRRPFYLREHVNRLFNSAKCIGLEIPYTNEQICEIVDETIARNPDLDEANVRIVFTGGVSSDGVCPENNGKLIIYVTPAHAIPDWWYTNGAKVITVDVERHIPEAKSINYMNAVIANMKAKEEEAIEAIYVDREGRVLEGTTTNVFFFKGNKLITAKGDILSGITRTVILDRLVKGNFDVELRDIYISELPDFDEMFIAASNKEIVPVVTVNDLTISNGNPGPNTKKMMLLFREYTTAYGNGAKDALRTLIA
jgi:branched-chain amino acid aminotransferase